MSNNRQIGYNYNALPAILFFSAIFVLFDMSYAAAAVFLFAILAAVLAVIRRGGTVHFQLNYFHIWILVLALFCFLSSIWAWDEGNAITKGKTVFSMLLCYSFLWAGYQDTDSTDPLLKAILWGGNVVMLVIVFTYGLDGILNLLRYDDRLSEQFYLNSNTVGVLCAMSMVVNCYYLLEEKRLHWWNLFLLLGLVMVPATGSRQALALLVCGVVLLLFLTAVRGKSPAQIAILLLVGILLLAGALVLISRISAFSGIYKRIQSLISAVTGVGKTDRSATTRLALIDVGIRQFKQNPVLGVGMGSGHLVAWKYLSRGYYLHNNFAEILADGGLTGFVLYYSVYVWIFWNMIRYRRIATPETGVCLVLLVMVLVEDYAAVTYYNKETYFYLMLGAMEVERLKRRYHASLPSTLTVQAPFEAAFAMPEIALQAKAPKKVPCRSMNA